MFSKCPSLSKIYINPEISGIEKSTFDGISQNFEIIYCSNRIFTDTTVNQNSYLSVKVPTGYEKDNFCGLSITKVDGQCTQHPFEYPPRKDPPEPVVRPDDGYVPDIDPDEPNSPLPTPTPNPNPGTETDPDTKPGTETDPDTKPGTETDPKPNPDTKPGTDTEPEVSSENKPTLPQTPTASKNSGENEFNDELQKKKEAEKQKKMIVIISSAVSAAVVVAAVTIVVVYFMKRSSPQIMDYEMSDELNHN
ncbi:HNH endonuclease domain protein, putative [Trichomonas vaginalis G3]|uniref:HNH endonuclease domain protein, putative n=1 Tax=Trichomonas vaginalis (strain ATCC PRA-98 / G3) TaxID=412133 RepID=A2FWZ8_TRIV3|nr:hypothetical protein TVAGG3_0740910 [Trichomonas vaginalis G3]EAX90575.1 HNH endonuclease domain protein, putative [Trichomonas vaginalis G3]KAI5511878.1 hypothetical protein TVAGG3_0740910 [Trichomonas vaginalis G3]|eukprot:XP_001303505.1 HNH endonuclease domain protein [Trichomonas vaginalis G3]